MADYDESNDIDALLRSSLRGEETNPPGVDGGVAESAETAARRRRIRFDVTVSSHLISPHLISSHLAPSHLILFHLICQSVSPLRNLALILFSLVLACL